MTTTGSLMGGLGGAARWALATVGKRRSSRSRRARRRRGRARACAVGRDRRRANRPAGSCSLARARWTAAGARTTARARTARPPRRAGRTAWRGGLHRGAVRPARRARPRRGRLESSRARARGPLCSGPSRARLAPRDVWRLARERVRAAAPRRAARRWPAALRRRRGAGAASPARRGRAVSAPTASEPRRRRAARCGRRRCRLGVDAAVFAVLRAEKQARSSDGLPRRPACAAARRRSRATSARARRARRARCDAARERGRGCGTCARGGERAARRRAEERSAPSCSPAPPPRPPECGWTRAVRRGRGAPPCRERRPRSGLRPALPAAGEASTAPCDAAAHSSDVGGVIASADGRPPRCVVARRPPARRCRRRPDSAAERWARRLLSLLSEQLSDFFDTRGRRGARLAAPRAPPSRYCRVAAPSTRPRLRVATSCILLALQADLRGLPMRQRRPSRRGAAAATPCVRGGVCASAAQLLDEPSADPVDAVSTERAAAACRGSLRAAARSPRVGQCAERVPPTSRALPLHATARCDNQQARVLPTPGLLPPPQAASPAR